MENLILVLKAVIIGIVEGITEFLPISSTGHMILVGHFIKFEGDFAKLFEIVIQLGAILAIIVLYKKKIFNSLKSLNPGGMGFKLWSGIILAFIPSGIVALLFYDKIKELLMGPVTVAAALLAGGLWMIYAEKKYRKNKKTLKIEDVSYRQAFIIGLFQCISLLWPGFSRSASTIIGGWIVGLSTGAAAEFSFFLALPTMIIASGYSLLKADMALSGIEVASLVIGFIVSFVVALIVVDRFISFLKKKPMVGFALYRILVGVIILAFALFGIL
ncbi:MAG: undecaprenyl-diphosphate phosphatase [Clostridiales bacterium]|jgi:undecaprenyl-diphosphatase|nr:undecaprenyl-diphosphate phosphatase [Eubacteriales bacterium]MDH7565145.1 undecaprenyl-diphosphate phosphatase [Clostridiales bacterium]